MTLDRRSFLRLSASGLAVSAILSPATVMAQAAAPVRGGIAVIGQDANPPSLDPHKSPAFATTNVTEHIYSCLLRPALDGSGLEGDLATEWEVVDDTTYRFTLRQNVQFHNGDAMTAADVKYTFDRIADPETASPWRALFSPVTEVEVVDDYTVVLHLSAPFAPLLRYLSDVKYSAIVNERDVTERGDLASGGAGTGPFKLDSFAANASIRLSRHEGYHEEGLPYLDGIELRIIPDEGSRVAALRSGSCQLTWVGTPEVVDQVVAAQGFSTAEDAAASRVLFLELDQQNPPFNDVRVRRAFSMAMNRQQIADIVWRGRATTTAAVPPSQQPFGYSAEEAMSLPYHAEDLDAARALMAEAGHADGLDTTFAVSPLTFSDVAVAQVIQQQVVRVGIRISIEQKEWGSLVQDFQATLSPISMAGLIPAPDPDANINIRLSSSSSVNPGKTQDAELDALLVQGRETVDEEARIEIYRQMQQRIADQVLAIYPAAMPIRFELWRAQLTGYVVTPNASRASLRQAWLAS